MYLYDSIINYFVGTPKDIDRNLVPIIISVVALLVSIVSIFVSVWKAKIISGDNAISLLFEHRKKYHATLHEHWQLSKDERDTNRWKNIMKLEIQAYANMYETVCAKYSLKQMNKRVFREIFKDDIIYFYETNWGKQWGVNLQDDSKPSYYYIRKVYSEFINQRNKKNKWNI